LSEESRKRIDKNILRIFDSKIESDQIVMNNAPLLIDFIDEESRQDFEAVKVILSQIKIPFEVDPKLVRGLDYYTKTTFEIISGKVGAQSALCGGGRYDLLVEQLEGKPTPGVGFAAGIERILLACENENSFKLPEEKIDLYIVKIENNISAEAAGLTSKVFDIATTLRRKNLSVEFDYLNRSVKSQMREANKLNAKFVLIVGGEEYKSGYYNLKNMKTGEQQLIPFDKLDSILIQN